MELSLAEAKGYLDYFFTKSGGSNIVVSVGGQQLKSYDELVTLANSDRYKDQNFIEVGLYLSNDGQHSIWPAAI